MISGFLPATGVTKGVTKVLDLVADLDRDKRPRESVRTRGAVPGWLERDD